MFSIFLRNFFLASVVFVLLLVGLTFYPSWGEAKTSDLSLGPIPPPPLKARAAILYEASTDTVLYGSSYVQPIPPASMSKLMTMYVVFEALKKGQITVRDKVTVSPYAREQIGSRMFLEAGTEVSINDLLQGAIVQSGNDACVALAEAVAGSTEIFVSLMNQKAKELGLSNSHFANVTGLPDDRHYMSPFDLAKLTAIIITDYPEYYSYYSQKEFTWNNIRQFNRNPLLNSAINADGVKTGYTDEAGFSLVGSIKSGEMRLISVVSGLKSSAERKKDSIALLSWGAGMFKSIRPVRKEQVVAYMPVWGGNIDKIPAIVGSDVNILRSNSKAKDFKIYITHKRALEAPIKKGDIVGTLSITSSLKERPVIVNLLSPIDVIRGGFWQRLNTALKYLWQGNGDTIAIEEHNISMSGKK